MKRASAFDNTPEHAKSRIRRIARRQCDYTTRRSGGMDCVETRASSAGWASSPSSYARHNALAHAVIPAKAGIQDAGTRGAARMPRNIAAIALLALLCMAPAQAYDADFTVYDADGAALVRFDAAGNVELCKEEALLVEGAASQQLADRENDADFSIETPDGPVARIDGDSGNFFIKGYCVYDPPIFDDSASAEFFVEDPRGRIRSMITPQGKLRVCGKVILHDFSVTHAAPQSYDKCGTVDITVTLDYDGAADVNAIGLEETLPRGWMYAGLVSGTNPGIYPASGDTGKITFGWIDTPNLPVMFTYRVTVPDDQSGTKGISGYIIARLDGCALYSATDTVILEEGGDECSKGIPEKPEPEIFVPVKGKLCKPHAADTDYNLQINLTELLRVIQFYNIEGLHCADDPGATEDGYVPGFDGDHSCERHSSDYQGDAWKIDLTELLRIIQFFNIGGYYPLLDPGESEDGFRPGLGTEDPDRCPCFEHIVIGDIDGFGWGNGDIFTSGLNNIRSATLDPENEGEYYTVNPKGIQYLGPGCFLPNMDSDALGIHYGYQGYVKNFCPVPEGTGDIWDCREEGERNNPQYVTGDTHLFEIRPDSETTGAQFTDITLDKTYDMLYNYRTSIIPPIPDMTFHPFPYPPSDPPTDPRPSDPRCDCEEGEAEGEGSGHMCPDGVFPPIDIMPLAIFDFWVHKYDISSEANLYVNAVIGDFDAVPGMAVELRTYGNAKVVTVPLRIEPPGAVGVIQGLSIPLAYPGASGQYLPAGDQIYFEDVFFEEPGETDKWHGYLEVDFRGTGRDDGINGNETYNREPYTVFDFIELSTSQYSANVIRVASQRLDYDVDYHDIQSAVDGAGPGSTIVIEPDVNYFENIAIGGKWALWLRADLIPDGDNIDRGGTSMPTPSEIDSTPPDSHSFGFGLSMPVLSGNNAGRCLYIGNSDLVTISGLVIESGYCGAGSQGAGVYVDDDSSNTIIERCVIACNNANGYNAQGGGVYAGSPITLYRSFLQYNYSYLGGGGAYLADGSTAINCIFLQNYVSSGAAGLQRSDDDSDIVIMYCDFIENYDGPSISPIGPGPDTMYMDDYMARNCIFWGEDDYCDLLDHTTHCLIKNGPGITVPYNYPECGAVGDGGGIDPDGPNPYSSPPPPNRVVYRQSVSGFEAVTFEAVPPISGECDQEVQQTYGEPTCLGHSEESCPGPPSCYPADCYCGRIYHYVDDTGFAWGHWRFTGNCFERRPFDYYDPDDEYDDEFANDIVNHFSHWNIGASEIYNYSRVPDEDYCYYGGSGSNCEQGDPPYANTYSYDIEFPLSIQRPWCLNAGFQTPGVAGLAEDYFGHPRAAFPSIGVSEAPADSLYSYASTAP